MSIFFLLFLENYKPRRRWDERGGGLPYVIRVIENIIQNQWVLPSVFKTWSLLELSNGNYRKADSLLVKSWEVVRKINLSAYSAAGVTNPDYYRALIYVAQKKYAAAAGFLLSDIVRVRNLRNELLRDYKFLGEVYEELGDIGRSKEYYKAFISLQDSLLNDQKKYSAISFEVEQ